MVDFIAEKTRENLNRFIRGNQLGRKHVESYHTFTVLRTGPKAPASGPFVLSTEATSLRLPGAVRNSDGFTDGISATRRSGGI